MDDLLNQCVAGDHSAWSAFVERYARVICSAVQHVLTNRVSDRRDDLIQDMTQDVFVRLVKDDFRLLRSFDPTRASLVTYLTIIARSTTIDNLRRKQLNCIPLDRQPEPTVESNEPRNAPDIDIPPGLLSKRQKLVLHLLFDREMDVAEAAKTLGIDPQTIRSTKYKAILKLRAYFGQGKT